MTISAKDNPVYVTRNYPPSRGPGKYLGTGKADGSFASLLDDLSVQRVLDSGASQHAAILGAQQLKKLSLQLQEMLNASLYRIIEPDRRDSGSLPFLLRLFPPLTAPVGDGQASIIQPNLQKNDASAPDELLTDLINNAAERYGVDGLLIKSLIKAESNFDVRSTSSKGAMGLMQIMPDTARELGVRDPYDPRENIMGGTRYLKGLLDRYHGDTVLALAAYNWGMGNVENCPEKLPEETRSYIGRILRYYRDFETAAAKVPATKA